jgi:hypothetical protein
MFIRRCVALLVLLSSASPCATLVNAGPRQQDLDFVTGQLPKLHKNFFFQLDRTAFQKAAADLASRITSASDAEFYVGLSQLIAMASDAHTAIALNGTAAAPIGFQALPLGFRWLADGIFVTSTIPAYSRALGSNLVAVGGVPIDEVTRQLATVIPHGNDQWVRYTSQFYLAGQQILASALPGVDPTVLAVRVIGEATGGKPTEYGEVLSFTLPGSRLPGTYSTKLFTNPSYIPDLPSFMPDIPVTNRQPSPHSRWHSGSAPPLLSSAS